VDFNPTAHERGGDLQLFTKKVAIVALFGIVLLLLWTVRDVLILIFIAAVLAAGISPAVQRVRVLGRYRLRRNIPRGTAVVIVYFPFLLLVILLAVLLVPRLIGETRALRAQLPMLVEENVLTPLQHYIPVGPLRDYLKDGVGVPRDHVFGYVRGAATAVGSFVAVLFMVVYMLIDAHRLRNMFLLLYPEDVRGERRATMNRMARRMSSWLSAQLILSGIMGVTMFAAMLILRIPYALPLALLATLGEMVPVIGPIVGFAPALAVAILHSRWQFWSVLLIALVMQKIENFIIAPRVMSRQVSISPLTAFIAFMVGASLLGIVGALMAIPVAAIMQVAFDEAFVERRERRQDVYRAGTLTKARSD
jgi:predicted PurR-regulated permease PerM